MLQSELTDLFGAVAGLRLDFRIAVYVRGPIEAPQYEWRATVDCEGDQLRGVLNFADKNDLHVKPVDGGVELLK